MSTRAIETRTGAALRRREPPSVPVQTTSDRYWQKRKAIIALSAIGVGSMLPVSLLQLGLTRDLPDPPIRGFNSRKVNLSADARVFGLRDGPIALASFAANVPLALAGRRNRATTQPLLPLLAATKAFGEAVGSLFFFWKMPKKEKAWCAYCIAGAIVSVSIFALSVPEALASVRSLRRGTPMRL